MSASSIIDLDKDFAAELLSTLGEMECVFQRRPATGTDAEDQTTYGAWADLARVVPGSAIPTIYTPCYFYAESADPGEIVTADTLYDIERFRLLVPYAPDLLGSDRVRQVRHSTTDEAFWPLTVTNPIRTLAVRKIDHVHPVLTILHLEEVR